MLTVGRMQLFRWIWVILFVSSGLAGERMTVSVCTRGNLRPKVIQAAEAQAETLFRSADIEIGWAECEAGPEGDAAAREHWFTVRLRSGTPFITPDPGALDTLGEAFLTEENVGYIVEVYYQAVHTLAINKQVDLTTLLGYVIAHELGHLLLGPGHAEQGLMRRSWDLRDLVAIRQCCLKFSPAEGVRMRCMLQGAAGCAAARP